MTELAAAPPGRIEPTRRTSPHPGTAARCGPGVRRAGAEGSARDPVGATVRGRCPVTRSES